MRDCFFNSLASSRKEKILEEKNKDYKKIPKKFLKILGMDRTL
jgi:hypothetical protein